MQRELLDAESVARHLVKRGSVFGLPPGMFPDAMFTNLFPAGRGRASVAAGVKQGGRHLGFARDLICEMPHTPGDAGSLWRSFWIGQSAAESDLASFGFPGAFASGAVVSKAR